MLSKLNYYGIKHSSLRFDSYLSNRFQYVDINQHKSDTIPISIGVPQGSILGPLLFIIYINDIDNSTSFFNFIKYADDTYSSSKDGAEKREGRLRAHEWSCDRLLRGG